MHNKICWFKSSSLSVPGKKKDGGKFIVNQINKKRKTFLKDGKFVRREEKN